MQRPCVRLVECRPVAVVACRMGSRMECWGLIGGGFGGSFGGDLGGLEEEEKRKERQRSMGSLSDR